MHLDEPEKDPKLSNDELKLLRAYGTFHNRIVNFQNKAGLFTFEDVFGQEDAERLFKHFRFDCQEQFPKFMTYLTTDQKNMLYVHVLRCERYR